jgi:DNA-directed RNA polymerase specialized sigma24 family protein
MVLSKTSQKNYDDFKNKLINYSRKYKIQLEDLEEIVNDSIFKAWNNCNEDRGKFESYCLVIIKNKIFNFTRDNANLFLLVLIDENEDIFKADEYSIEDKENNIIALKYFDKLRTRLSEEELKLFDELYKMCESFTKADISKASRNIGLDPEKGWNLFRKIQRKAVREKSSPSFQKGLPFISEEGANYSLNSKIITEYDMSELQTEIKSENKTEPLFSRFTEEDLKKLDLMYNF